MSNTSYDMDTSGGLMPLIRALIKPPDEEPSVPKPKKSQHPYYKRPGKGHNHDSCDACGEGGDLICCDRCPASFHLGCYDPPLDENDIPAGLWLCRECRASDEANPPSARGSRAQTPADKSDTEKKTRNLRSRDSSKKQSKDDDSEDEKTKKASEPEKQLSPMEILVQAARIMNPTQFQLPREMRIPCIFPGTDKEGSKNGSASVVTVDPWGCVPLPAKSCYVCRATCKMAPLLQCDYCPLLFHQDCLDPPLTALPTGRWMCPNHVENFIDWKLVNSISATERVALWDRFTGPVDQHAIKIDFIRQARRYPTKFRHRAEGAARGRVLVPRSVRAQYARPPPLLPARRDHVRCTRVLNSLKKAGVYSESDDEDSPKVEICLNPVCVENPELHQPTAAPRDNCSKNEDTEPEEEKDKIKADSESGSGSESSSVSESELAQLAAAVRRRRLSPRAASPPFKRRVRLAAGADRLLALVDDQLRMIDERLLKLLAWQRLRQILAGEQCHGAFQHTPVSEALARAVIKSLPPASAHLAPLPSELLSSADRERIASTVWGRAPPAAPGPAPAPAPALGDECVRAVLCPARCGGGGGGEAGRPVPMRRAHVTVGAASDCGVRLDAARCRQVSQRHAVIFMDEVTRHFELINYSEFGTRVNGVTYACDVSHTLHAAGDALHAPHAPHAAGHAGDASLAPHAAGDERDLRAEALRDLVARRAPKPLRVNGNLTAPIPGEHPCRCPPPRAPAGAWEGSALVPHGALLEFGCLAYVFSITDTAELKQEEPAL